MAKARGIFVVFNTGSGRQDRVEAREAIERVLREGGVPFELLEVARGSDVPEAARRAAKLAAERAGVVAAGGGDGTLNAVAQAAFEADVPFGAVPLGTFNYFARDNGIPLDPAEAARVLIEGEVAAVQVGLVNGRVFLVNASFGFYPLLLEEREAFKARYGRTRWVSLLAALWTLLTRRQPKLAVSITYGGETRTVPASTLFVGNNALQLRRLGIEEAQAVEEGCLAAIRVRPTSAWKLLDLLLYGAIGRLGAAGDVEAFSFTRMEIALRSRRRRPPRRAPSLKIALDGESLRLGLPLDFRVAPRPLRLLRPAQARP